MDFTSPRSEDAHCPPGNHGCGIAGLWVDVVRLAWFVQRGFCKARAFGTARAVRLSLTRQCLQPLHTTPFCLMSPSLPRTSVNSLNLAMLVCYLLALGAPLVGGKSTVRAAGNHQSESKDLNDSRVSSMVSKQEHNTILGYTQAKYFVSV